MNVRLKLSLVGVGAVVFGYLALILLTPQYGRVVGYADRQAALDISSSSSGDEIERIQQLVKLHLEYRPEIARDYWPEPIRIEEHPGCWLVTFKRKVPVYRFLGFQETVEPTDKVMFIAIEKQGGAVRFGKWCP